MRVVQGVVQHDFGPLNSQSTPRNHTAPNSARLADEGAYPNDTVRRVHAEANEEERRVEVELKRPPHQVLPVDGIIELL